MKISQHPVHDLLHAKKLLRQCHKTRRSDLYVMDKGYDSENIHELIRDTRNSCSLIPVRTRKRKRISGYYQKRLSQSFNVDANHQQNKVETVFSVLIRKYGESLKARKYRLQVKVIKMKVILYNLSKIISTFVLLIRVGDVYKATSIMPFIYRSITIAKFDLKIGGEAFTVTIPLHQGLITVNITETQYITLLGWATDSPNNSVAKAVFILVDEDTMVPAWYLRERKDFARHFDNSVLFNSGFWESVNIGHFDDGNHTLRIRIASKDGSGY